MASLLGNMACTYKQPKSPNEMFDGKRGKIEPQHLVEFGRIGYVTIRKKIQKK